MDVVVNTDCTSTHKGKDKCLQFIYGHSPYYVGGPKHISLRRCSLSDEGGPPHTGHDS